MLMALRDTVVQNLRRLMEAREIPTPTHLARLSGVPQSILSRVFNGVHSNIKLDHIESLARVLEVNPADLLATNAHFYADHRTAQVVMAMEKLNDWGKEMVAASAEALATKAQDSATTPPGHH